jgi:hypothetical protein
VAVSFTSDKKAKLDAGESVAVAVSEMVDK